MAGFALALTALWGAHAGRAEPVAFVANADSNSISVVDVNARVTRANVMTWNGVSASSGREPKDVLVDPQSGRVFAATHFELVSFDGRLADGSGLHRAPASDESSGLAIDAPGRRIFMSHEQLGSQPDGVVSEFSIANAAAPVMVASHGVPGAPDLRFIAWDARYRRVYVIDDSGAVARTGASNLTFGIVSGLETAAPNPGGILADPAGGVWVTSRNPGKLVRIFENGTKTEYAMSGAANPRGMAFDVAVPGTILIAVDDLAQVQRFTPSTAAFSLVMNTDLRPQDVGVTQGGARVSANRIASSGPGTVTVDGASAAMVQDKPVAIAVVEVASLTPTPGAQTFCWNRNGDRDERSFQLQNTSIDRRRFDLGTLQVGGLNPANYAITVDSCSAARLNWSDTCTFSLRFTASGPSNQPPNPFVTGPQIATWPAEASIASTDATASAKIALKAGLNLNPCRPLPVIVARPPIFRLP